jgi:hypothetical protein
VDYYLVIKKEESADVCYDIDKPQKHYAKWKNPDSKRPLTLLLHLYKVSRAGRVAQTTECLPNKRKALSSNPTTTKKKKKCNVYNGQIYRQKVDYCCQELEIYKKS